MAAFLLYALVPVQLWPFHIYWTWVHQPEPGGVDANGTCAWVMSLLWLFLSYLSNETVSDVQRVPRLCIRGRSESNPL